ncbi:unnamed protein product [Adineta ricciae]|uniref:OTU domain-containing protein n=1 Tax=Adineta ricciae TaxID=249248 RepID=A0A815Y382_ADIRI|nr:unnamed protein product [Adineta ricciae]CAF1565506.1 unnamed protein product [Adineta ricciae]
MALVESDGNCFFRALSDQICNSEGGHILLRALIIGFMNDNAGEFQQIIDYNYYLSWANFIYKMLQSGIFVDAVVIIASAMFLQRVIIIHQFEQRPILFKPSIFISNNNQIHLAYDSEKLHYNSLWSIEGKRLQIDESECRFA